MTEISENYIEDIVEEFCTLVEKFSKITIPEDTPMYNFQQSLIVHCKKFKNELS
jgi:hypothetical protein